MIQPNPKAELLPAFFWICDECGQDNFIRPVEVSHERIKEMLEEAGEEYDEDDFEGMEFSVQPELVECSHCKTIFETERPEFDDDEEE